MTQEEFKKLNKGQLEAYGILLPMGITKDENGNITSYRYSDGHWWEADYEDRHLTSYRRSDGYCSETTYKEGNITSYRNSNGLYEVNFKEVSKEEYEEFIKDVSKDIDKAVYEDIKATLKILEDFDPKFAKKVKELKQIDLYKKYFIDPNGGNK